MQRWHLSNWQIWNMSVGLLGINFGWGLQMANMSAIYEYLGASPDKIPILWLAAPLTGLLVQPIIGYMSDNTWCALGRRRPYFLVGAILACLALILMPLSTSLWMAAVLLWILDGSVNVSMGPFRALVPDLLEEVQRTKGYIFQGIAISMGTVLASALPWFLQHVLNIQSFPSSTSAIPWIVKLSFWIGAVIFIGTILWTVLTTKEFPYLHPLRPSLASKRSRLARAMTQLWQDIVNMPQMMRRLAWVMMFSWMGLFCMFLYFPITVATTIFHGAPHSSAYLSGLEWAGVCFAMYSVFFLIFSFALPFLTRIFTRAQIYCVSLFFGAMGLMGVFLVKDKYELIILMLGVGVAFAGMQTMPYAILADTLPEEKIGIYMGIFNLFIVIPEIIISLGFGWLMHHVLDDNRMLGVVSGGLFMLIACVLTCRIKKTN